MRNILTYLLLTSLAVLGACASTTQPDPDGQTHWMTRCDEQADCGALSCICGVCTELCTASDECSAGESVATCLTTANVLDTAACTTRQATASVCVPLCDGQSDCDGVASDLACSSARVCTLDDRPTDEGDGSVPDVPDANDRDATVDEEGPPPIIGTITPIEAACDEDGNLDGTGPFEILASGDIGTDALEVAPDGTVFGVGVIDTVRNSAFRVVDGEMDGFGAELWEIQHMVIEGGDLITGKSDGYEATIAATNLDTQQKLILAREEALNVDALTADAEAVYWVGHLDQEPVSSRIWRSTRVPGESVLLAEMAGTTNHLIVLGDYLYFMGVIDNGSALIRIAKDGSSSAFEEIETPRSAANVHTDGQHLFYSLLTEYDDLGNPLDSGLSIMRMDPATLTPDTLLDTEEQVWAMVAGDPYLYWTSQQELEDFKPVVQLWRGASDGSAAPQQLGTLEAYVESLAERDGQLYWVSTCRIGDGGTTKSHIVTITQ